MILIDNLFKTILMLIIFLLEKKLFLSIDEKFQQNEFFLMKKQKNQNFLFIILYCMAAAFLNPSESITLGILEVFFWSGLVTAAYSDFLTREVYDLVYFPAITAGLLELVILQVPLPILTVIEILQFTLIQWFVFRFFYGEADCFIFITCAIYLAALGGGFLEFMLLMAGTFLLLAIIQAFRKNINKKGNLKEPVALIPYIAFIMLFF